MVGNQPVPLIWRLIQDRDFYHLLYRQHAPVQRMIRVLCEFGANLAWTNDAGMDIIQWTRTYQHVFSTAGWGHIPTTEWFPEEWFQFLAQMICEVKEKNKKGE